ncbi:MAG: hypothetical protein PVH18_11260, partial [Chloroflexota bacterium]
MLDLNLIREKPDWVKKQIASLNDTAPIDEILAADERRRQIIQEEEALRRQVNVASKSIGKQIGQLRQIQSQIAALEGQQANGDTSATLVDLRRDAERLEQEIAEAKDAPRKIGDQIAILDEDLKDVETALR